MVATRTTPAATTGTSTTWKNWGGNQECRPMSIETPGSEEEIVAIVRGAAERGERVKVFGAGHSFTDIACTEGRLISLERYHRVLHVDERQCTVKVQAGITIEKLGAELVRYGLAQPNLGDIGYQSIAGPSPPPPMAPAATWATSPRRSRQCRSSPATGR